MERVPLRYQYSDEYWTMWHHARRTTRGGDDKAGGEDFIWGGLHTTFCTILRKKQETMVHTMSKSHEALIIACPIPRPGPMYGVKRRINKSLQDLPKNLNLILSFPPHHISFFFFLVSLRIGRTTSPNPGGTHKPHHESFENVSDVCYEEITTLPRTGFMRAGYFMPRRQLRPSETIYLFCLACSFAHLIDRLLLLDVI